MPTSCRLTGLPSVARASSLGTWGHRPRAATCLKTQPASHIALHVPSIAHGPWRACPKALTRATCGRVRDMLDERKAKRCKNGAARTAAQSAGCSSAGPGHLARLVLKKSISLADTARAVRSCVAGCGNDVPLNDGTSIASTASYDRHAAAASRLLMHGLPMPRHRSTTMPLRVICAQ